MADFGRRAEEDEEDYHIRFREDEEMEFFTELALHETERWIQTVTKQSFKYQDDTRKSLENGVLLCELLNGLRPGTIKRINKLPTPLAGLDNINVFLKACKNTFGLTDTHLFNPSDLEDLSQRAIAESDQLRAEYDRRLRNVAITIYWLGQQVASQPHLYQGPQLDLTAFSALVNRKHHDLVHRGDWEAAGAAVTSHQRQISGYGGGSNSSTSRHTRDSSLDGYDKAESVNSLDENSFEMPMNRYNSASALYNTNNSNTATSISNKFSKMPNNDSGFDGGVGGNMYRGSPDLGAGGSGSASHRRYSSTDSMDGSSHYSGHSGGHSGGHSRQGSVSDEVAYPTRRVSITTPRRQSTSADPLQFVKSKGAQDMAQIAQVQMKVAAESKKEATITRTKDDDIDWQANLSTWKNRRKSQSERSYQLREELEKMEKEKEEGSSGPVLPTKTYSQMQEERERRKSTGRKFYPIEDEEEEEETFHATSVSRVESSLPSHGSRQSQRNDWSERDEGNTDSKTKNQNDDNNNKNNGGGDRSWRDTSQATLAQDEPTASALLADRRASRSKLSQKLRSFDEDAEDSGWSSKSATSDQPSRYRRSGAPDFSSSNSSRSMNNGVTSASRDTNGSNSGPLQDSSSEETSDNSRADSAGARPSNENSSIPRSYNSSNSSNTAASTSNVKLTTRNVGSRTQSKIGSIMRNFEEADSKPAAPKQGYNERVNLSARKSAFEVTTPREDTTIALPRSSNANSVRAVPQSTYPVDDSPGEEDSSSGSDDEEDEGSADDGKSGDVKGNAEQQQTGDFMAKQFNTSNNSAPQMFSATPATFPSATSATKDQDVGKNCVEKTIKISQAKNSDRGFGFFLTGGADTDQPLAVSKVALGSSADVCDLRLRDQILTVNQQDVTSMTATQVGDIVARAVTSGNIELHIRREKGEDDFEEDEEDFSSSTEGEEDLATPGYADTQLGQDGQTSVMDQLAAERQWLEQQIEQQTDQDKRRNTEDEDQARPEEAELHQTSHTVTLTIPDIGSRNKQNDNDPVKTSITEIKPNTTVTPGDASGWSDGPPAVLRKWQRQRQKEEYAFDSPGGKDVAETFRKISLNTAMPKLQDRDADRPENEAPPPGTAQAWDHRHDQWTREQDGRRQLNREPDASTAQAEFEENQAKMKSAYEDALKKAEEKERDRKRQEQEMLQPELDKAQLLEERKAERRARIFNTAAAATAARSPSPPPPPPSQDDGLFAHRQHLYGNQFEEQPPAQVAPPANNVQSSSVVFRVEPLQQQQHQQQQHQQPQQHSQSFKVEPAYTQQQEGVFVIDPRNRQQQSDYSAKPVAFHVNLAAPGKGTSAENHAAALLEAERERIRLEELRKIEDEKKRAEEELKAKEMEEMRKIREKEEELQREKEMLRLERERFFKEQEDFKRFKEQQQQQQQQQQHQPRIVDGPKPFSNNMSSHQAQKPQINSINNSYQDNKNFTPRSNNAATNSLPKWPPVNTNYSNNPAITKASSNSSNNTNQQVGRARGFTREEMLSPSRPQAALATTNRDRREWNSPNRDKYQQQQQQQQQHSQPRQQQINQKQQQQLQSQQPYPYTMQNPSPVGDRGRSPQSIKKNPQFQGLSDHWLVEEAERRRLAETEGRLHNTNAQPSVASSAKVGPIQPHAELPNRWRGGDNGDRPQQQSGSMPAAIRQTLLLKTANVRGSNGPNDAFDGDLAPPPPPHDPYHLSPSSNSPSRSPARSPSGYRSVSPPGNRSPNYSHHYHHPQNHQQQYHQQQLQQQQQPQQHQQQQQYRQQIHRHSPQQPQAYQPHHQSPSPYRPPQYYDQSGNSYSDVPQRQAVPPYKAHSPAPPPPHAGGDNGLPVSGSQLCSYCDQELGFGAAMVIESLGLYYHVNCFRCCVCHTSLGTGSQGADVRVRANQLHCPDCYSNDEGFESSPQYYQSRRVQVIDESSLSGYTASGLKFSKV